MLRDGVFLVLACVGAATLAVAAYVAAAWLVADVVTMVRMRRTIAALDRALAENPLPEPPAADLFDLVEWPWPDDNPRGKR